MIGLTVVGKHAATVKTSSLFLILLSPSKGDVKAANASKFAEEPELTGITCLTLRNDENFLIKFFS